MLNFHEIDYKLYGDDMQLVEIELDPKESVMAEAGAMMYMESGIEMETIFGDSSGKNSGQGMMGKLLGAGKRLITGESLFMTIFTNVGSGKKHVSFAAPYPGKIIPLDLSRMADRVISSSRVTPGGKSKGEGNILDMVGGIGNLFDGD